jgi:hypothetical protein
MSNPQNANAAFTLLQSWLEPVRAMDKQASESTETVIKDPAAAIKNSQVRKGIADSANGAPAGTSPIDLEDAKDEGLEGVDGKSDVGGSNNPATIGGADAPPSITNVKVETSNMEQKQARAERLGNSIIRELQGRSAAQRQLQQQPAKGQDKEAADKEAADMLDKEAQEQAGLFYHYYKAGRLQRAQDEMEMKEANLDPKVLEAHGGASALLDKIAMEDPAAVLPEELLGEVGGEVPMEGAGDPEAEAAMEEIGQMLEANGVTPEELDQIMQQLVALKENGFEDEEIMAALEEMAMEEEAAAPMEEAVPELAGKEAAEQIFRTNVDKLKNYWRG